MDPTLQEVLDKDLIIPVLAIVCGSFIAVTAIIFTSLRAISVSRAREHTKREIAAYVAEGTLDPDKAVAMLNAGRPHLEAGQQGNKGKCCA